MHIPNLREMRELHGLTQKELAEVSNVSLRSIAGYEGGAHARPNTARKLAQALNVEVADLAGASSSPKAQAPLPDFASEQRREPKVHTSGANLKGTGTLDVGEGILLIGEKRRKSIEEQALKKVFERTERGELSAEEAMDEVLEKAETTQ